MNCAEMELLIPLYACEELEGEERSAVETHVAACASCRERLARERRLLEALAAERAEPSPVLLASCRNQLNDAMDLISAKQSVWQRLSAWLRPPQWLAAHPAWSAALFLLIGASVGATAPQWLGNWTPSPDGEQAQEDVRPERLVPASTTGTQDLQDLDHLSVSNIHWVPESDPAMPKVQLEVRAAPLLLEGTLDDGNVKRVLLHVVENSQQRFRAGQRLESVELLQARNQDAEVRQALCNAVRRDRNPGVRLRALEALRGLEQEAAVRQTLLDALLHDQNHGVRVQAVTALRAMAERGSSPADPRLLEVLRDRMQNDPSTFVRLQSAAAVRQLGPRQAY